MKFVDEFRNKKLVLSFSKEIKRLIPKREVSIMEVCGTHTHNFMRFGLRKFLPDNLKFISGPGCPVCVSSPEYIDQAIAYSKLSGVIMLSFGDMLRVPGRISSLEKERGAGADVRVVYSPLDALTVAKNNPEKKVIFLAVGFETTAPAFALTIIRAKKDKIKNLFFFTSLKLIPAAMRYLAVDKELKLDGFLCPGHVSSIIGTKPYEFLPKKFRLGCCISGFEPVDILESLSMLLKQIKADRPKVDNQYARAVRTQGNPQAQKIIRNVFEEENSLWRGLGIIKRSGLKIKNDFAQFDAEKEFHIGSRQQAAGRRLKCKCSDILKGKAQPKDCVLFKKTCTPDKPYGPCMVSAEGACNAHYKYL